MRILVTGAGGFLGRHLVAELGPRHEVVALTRRAPPRELRDLARWLECDLRALDTTVLPDRVDTVIHLAQSSRYREFPEGAEDMFAVNVASTFALLEYARAASASAFALASTGGVYGRSRVPVRESDRPHPTSFYFRSKLAAEALLEGYAGEFRTLAFRFFFIYGPGQQRMLIPSLAARVAARQEIVIEGNPGLRINPIYVDDATRVFEPALTSAATGTFNVAGEEQVTITELVELIGDAVDERPRVRHEAAQADGDLVADVVRIRDELGVRAQVPLVEGLRALVAQTPSIRAAQRSPTAS
jgi:nucleoside-diphosphate-sugar epimerase